MADYVGFGNDELAKLPVVKWGDTFTCSRCGNKHKLTNQEPWSSKNRDLALFYSCNGKQYLGAVNGRLVVKIKPSVTGNV